MHRIQERSKAIEGEALSEGARKGALKDPVQGTVESKGGARDTPAKSSRGAKHSARADFSSA